MGTPFKMKGFSGFKDSPFPQDVETKTKSTKRVDKSRSRLLAGGDPSKLTYTTKSGSEIEAIDIKKKTKKGKSGKTKKIKEVVVHGGGGSKTKRIQKVTKSGEVKTKTVTWRDGKRTVSRSTSDSLDTGPILSKSPLKQTFCISGKCTTGLSTGKLKDRKFDTNPGTVVSRTVGNIFRRVKKWKEKRKIKRKTLTPDASTSWKNPRTL